MLYSLTYDLCKIYLDERTRPRINGHGENEVFAPSIYDSKTHCTFLFWSSRKLVLPHFGIQCICCVVMSASCHVQLAMLLMCGDQVNTAVEQLIEVEDKLQQVLSRICEIVMLLVHCIVCYRDTVHVKVWELGWPD
jgi:hypothetical protein